MKIQYVSELIGNTPCILLDEDANTRRFLKLEGYNPTGSVKDRACYHMIRMMRERGILKNGMTLLDASSGNFASALAYYGRILGYPVEVVVSSKLTREKERFIEYHGAKITKVGNFTIDGNRYCRDLIEKDGGNGYCFIDQLHNWDNPEAYYHQLAPEILKDLPDVSAIIGSLGSGGTMLGIGKYMKERKPDVRIVVVQSVSGSSIPGVGSFDDGDYVTPFIRKGLELHIFDQVIKVDQQSCLEQMLQFRDKGIFCGLQAGGVIQAMQQAVADRQISGNVVAIAGDSGWKNMDKLLSLM